MANKIVIKRTTTSGLLPNVSNSSNTSYIAAGELAINLTDRKLLSSNGSATFEVGANLASIVVGTAFTQTSGNANFDSGVLFVDGTNNRVGVGTITPGQTFTVNGAIWLNQTADYSGASSKIQMSAGSNTDNIMIRTNSLYLYNYGNTGETLLRFGNGVETWQMGTSTGATPDFRLYELNGTSTRIMVKAGGNVGIGTTTPGYKLEVNGSFAATTKSFVITHPTKPDMKLRYGSLEGPENGVYVRGRSKNGIIRLPDYWTGLVDEFSITVNLTPIGSHQKLYVKSIENNTIIVGGGFFDEMEYFYTVFAERKDVDKLVVEI